MSNHQERSIVGSFNLNIANYQKRNQILIFIIWCCFFLLINLSSLFLPQPKSLTYDEDYYYQSGLDILSGKPSESQLRAPNIMPASALNPIFSKAIRTALPDRFASTSAGKVYFGKLATIFVALILAVYVFIWSRQLYGINAAFLALSLYVFDPNIIAHARIVHQNIFGTSAIFIATYYFWRLLNFGGRKNLVFSTVSFGIAQVSRYTAIYLLPIYLILTLIFYRKTILNLIINPKLKNICTTSKQFALGVITFALAAILIVNIGFSFEKTFTKFGNYQFASESLTALQADVKIFKNIPVPIPYAYLKGLDMGKYKQEAGFGNLPTYLMGKLGLENGKMVGFKEYFIIAFLYKVPIATQIILSMAAISLFRYRNRLWNNEAFLVIPVLFFFVAMSLSNAQIGIRYILTIFPFLFVFASRIALFWNVSKNRYRIFVFGLIAYLLVSNLSYYPHYLSYFNELLLDRKMAYTILADSNLDWGQNRFYLKRYLANHPETMLTPTWPWLDLNNNQNSQQFINPIFDPQQPQSGLVIIGSNELLGITADPQKYQWIRENLKPIDSIAHSYLLFKINRQDIPLP